MRHSSMVVIAGRPVAVRELTAAEVRAWLKDIATTDPAAEIDLADWLLFEDEGLRLVDFCRMTDLSPADLEAFSVQTDLEALYAKCKEVNPRFFLAYGRLLARGMAALRSGSTPSNAPAPSSPGWFTRMFGRGPGAR